MKRKGAISNTGYKSNSKDRFNDFNLIPSNRITMKGVDNPLLMIPMGDRGIGNPVMGAPGEEYFFPNYDMVMEMRLPKGASHMNYQRLQRGGVSDPSKTFLSNWYTNRNIPDQYIQGAYELDRPMYMRNLQNFPDYTVVPSIDNDPRITGRYDSNNGKVFLTPNVPSHVKTHELNHFMNMANNAGGYMRTIHGDIVRNELKPKSELSGVYKDKYDYFANPDEIHSRIMVLREKAKFKPNEVVTPKKLDNFMKKYKGNVDNINDLLDLSKDKNSLLNMLNYMAVNDEGQSLYTAAYGYELQNPYYKRGGQKKGSKKFTNKNIQSSVNRLMRRNETLYGSSGKKYFDPLIKAKEGMNMGVPPNPTPREQYMNYLDQYLASKEAYDAEQNRVRNLPNVLLQKAEEKDIKNIPTRTDLGWINEGRYFCSSHTCELLGDSGYTIPQDFTSGSKTYKKGQKIPLIPGNLQFQGMAPNMGFIPVESKNLQPGDVIQEKTRRTTDYQGNPYSGGWMPSHSLIYAGVDDKGQRMYYNTPGGVRDNYAKTPIYGVEDRDYKLAGWRYVGDLPQLEKQMLSKKTELSNLPLPEVTPLTPIKVDSIINRDNLSLQKTGGSMYNNLYRYDRGGDGPGRNRVNLPPVTALPTAADSLALIDNSLALDRALSNMGYEQYMNPQSLEYRDLAALNQGYANQIAAASRAGIDNYYRIVDPNRMYIRDEAFHQINRNLPELLVDRRIKPQERVYYRNTNRESPYYGDYLSMNRYDPVAITPAALRPKTSASASKTVTPELPIPELMQTRGVDSIPYTIPSYQREPLPFELNTKNMMPPPMEKFYFGKNKKEEAKRLAGKPYTAINSRGNEIFIPSGDLGVNREEGVGYYKGQGYIEETPNIDKRQYGGMASYTQPTEEQFFTFGYLPNSPVGFYDMGGAIGLPGGANELPCLECGGSMQDGGATQYGGQFEDDMIYDYKKGGWIQKVTKSIKRRGTEGVCTGDKFGGPSCPPGSKRYNLAKTFRAMAKKQYGGMMDTSDQDDYISQYSAVFQNRLKQNALNNMSDEAAEELTPYAQYGFQMPYYYDQSYNPNSYFQQDMYADRINQLNAETNNALSNMYGAAYDLKANANPFVKSIQIKTGDDVNERFWNKPYNIPEMRSRKRSFEYGGFEDDYELPTAQVGIQQLNNLYSGLANISPQTDGKTDLERALENSSNRELRSYSYLGRPLSSTQDAVSESSAAINAAAAQNTNTGAPVANTPAASVNTGAGTNTNTNFQYASGYKVPYGYYGNSSASNAGTSSGTTCIGSNCFPNNRGTETGIGSFDQWLAYQEWVKSQGQQPSQQQAGVTGANLFPMNFGRTRGNNYIPTIAYNPANTYLQDFDYKGRLFGQGPRRLRMKFRTYFDPVTGQPQQVPMGPPVSDPPPLPPNAQEKKTTEEPKTTTGTTTTPAVTPKAEEPKTPVKTAGENKPVISTKPVKPVSPPLASLPLTDPRSFAYFNEVINNPERFKDQLGKLGITPEQVPAWLTAAKEAEEKAKVIKTLMDYEKRNTDSFGFRKDRTAKDIFLGSGPGQAINKAYGGEPLQMYYNGGDNDMYGALERMNAKSLTDPMYAQQFIGEDELTNPLGINKDGVAYNKDGTRKKTPKNYEDWETDVKYGRGYQNEDLVNWGLAGVDTVSSLLRQREMKDLEQGFRRNTLADNVFMSASPANRTGSRGHYNVNTGAIDQQNMTAVQQRGANYNFSNPYVTGAYGGSFEYGGMYQEGGEYELSQDEIDYIMANGGSITYID